MESVSLKDFVAETLKAIALGVADAQDASKAAGGIPIALHSVGGERVSQGEQLVRFTVSVQAEHVAEKRAAADAKAAFVTVITGKVDASAQTAKTHHQLHTIEFSVPVHFNSRWQ